jgi:glucose-6-phosphate-specific signal transduction histidine kinase
MTKSSIGIIFITAGVAYGSLVFAPVYNSTVGFLVNNKWIKPPVPDGHEKDFLGPKLTIVFYSLILIGIGIYMLITPS